MGDDDRTMANLAKTTRTEVSSAITHPALKAENFEIKGQFLNMILNQCQFSGAFGEDVNDHIDTFLGICELFKIKDVDGDTIKLHVFPFTLTDTAKEWLKSNAPELLSEAWERLKKYLRQCPQHGLSKHKIVQTFYKGIDRPTRNTIENSAGGTIMHKTPNEAYKLIEDIAVHTHEWYIPQDGMSRRATTKSVEEVGVCDDKPMSSSEDACWVNQRQGNFQAGGSNGNAVSYEQELTTQYIAGQNAIPKDQQVSIHELKTQVGQLSKLASQRQPGSLPSNTETNPNAHVNAITTRSGKQTTDPPFLTNENVVKPVNQEKNNKVKSQSSSSTTHVKTPLKLYEPKLPYPGRYRKENEAEQYGKFLDLFKQLHINLPFVKALSQMPKYAKFLKDLLTNKKKLDDLSTVTMSEEYLGASINLMPYSMYAKVGLGESKPTRMAIQLADRSIKYPRGIMENVLVKVDRFVFLVDFVILEMDEDSKVPLILEVIFYIDKSIKYPKQDDTLYYVDTSEPLVEENIQGIFKKDLFETNFIREDMNMNSEENDSSEKEIKSGTRRKPKTSFEDPPVLELKDLSPYLEYDFLKSESKPPVIISSDLTGNEKERLIEVLKENKKETAFDIKGISPSYCTHIILLVDEYKPMVQPQRRTNPKGQDVVKKEFKQGDRVRLKLFLGKLRSRWSGPLKIKQVFLNGVVELEDPGGGSLKVNEHRVNHYLKNPLDKDDMEILDLHPKDN
nr:hypothetical protein [Tanacetum cinerariifolium]